MTSPTTTLTSNDDDSTAFRLCFLVGALAAVAGALVVVLVPHHRQAQPETRGGADHADLAGQEQPLSVQ